MAALQAIKAQAARAGAAAHDDPELHRDIVENVLCGLDINAHAVQLAACNLTLGAPTVDYRRMNLGTMPHGPQADGGVRAGSLELLTAADSADSLHGLLHPGRSMDELEAEHIDADERIEFQPKDLDLVIMNPPFTDNQKRARKFGAATTKRMQAHEAAVQAETSRRDPAAGSLITANSVRTFFSPLAEQALHGERGVYASIIPVTACTSASGIAERRFLAERFHVERIVTSHDPKRPNFSENTGIHEALLIAKRKGSGSEKPTEFVSLARMPGTNAEPRAAVAETLEAVEAILSGRHEEWGTVCHWPADRVKAGDWTPAQWYDPELASIAHEIEMNPRLAAAGTMLTTGPTGQAASDSWRRTDDPDAPQARRIFDSASAELRATMTGEPEQWVTPGGRRVHLHERVTAGRGHLMLATRCNTVSGRITALWSDEPTFGFAWVPARGPDQGHEQALCAWWNSTPGRILLLNRRAKMLTYPKWSVKHLLSVPSPRPGRSGCAELRAAWARCRDTELRPLREGDRCSVRLRLDTAAASFLGVSEDVVAEWRRRLACEPTVSNEYARTAPRTRRAA